MQGRLYDPNDVIKNNMAKHKMKPFIKEEDKFDDFFQGVKNFSDIVKRVSSQLNQENVEAFQVYRNKRLKNIPLNFLVIEDEKHTQCVSLDDEMKYISENESGQSKQQSDNLDQSEDESESKK